jgi:hypothetical protein
LESAVIQEQKQDAPDDHHVQPVLSGGRLVNQLVKKYTQPNPSNNPKKANILTPPSNIRFALVITINVPLSSTSSLNQLLGSGFFLNSITLV